MSGLRIEVIHGKEIDAGLWSAWEDVQRRSRRELRNPFFHPGYTHTVACIRDSVRVGVMEDGNRVVGVFPFEIRRSGLARPVGLRLSDYQGVVVPEDVEWDPVDLVDKCGIAAFEFDHLVAAQSRFAPYIESVEDSPIIEVDGGIEAYEQRRRQLGIKQYRDTARRGRKLGREIGEFRVEELGAEPVALRQMMEWKSAQCRETGTVDYFALGWPARLIEQIAAAPRGELSPLFTGLFVDDRLLAVQFFMRAHGIWHFWVMSSDTSLNRYSPGMILLREMISRAAASGALWIDFGKGMHLFKEHFRTGSIGVGTGMIERPSLLSGVRRASRAIEAWTRRSFLYPVVRYPGRLITGRRRRRRYE